MLVKLTLPSRSIRERYRDLAAVVRARIDLLRVPVLAHQSRDFVHIPRKPRREIAAGKR